MAAARSIRSQKRSWSLLRSLCELIAQYMALPHHADVAIALWLVHTSCIAAADYTPYILVTSPVPECGTLVYVDAVMQALHRLNDEWHIFPIDLPATEGKRAPGNTGAVELPAPRVPCQVAVRYAVD